MIDRLVDVSKDMNYTTNNNNVAINSLNYTRNFLCNGLRKLESDVSTIYNYIDSLDNRKVTLTLINPVELKAILKSIQKIIAKYLSLLNNLNTDIWSFYDFLKAHPLIINDTLMICLIVPLLDNTFHLKLHQVHSIQIVHTMLYKTLTIEIANPLSIIDDK